GYLRSSTALIQTIGRCARHLRGKAILYADVMTESMRTAIGETNRRRAKQMAYNTAHHITPQSIVKAVDMRLAAIVEADYVTVPVEDLRSRKSQAKSSCAKQSCNSRRKCARRRKSSNSSAPPPSATVSARSSSVTLAPSYRLPRRRPAGARAESGSAERSN